MQDRDGYEFTPQGIKSPHGSFLPFRSTPFKHQLQCLTQYGTAPYFALLAEMGTGKSWIAINNYAYLLIRRKVQNMLVIAPNGVQWNWIANELPKHLPTPAAAVVQYAGFSGGIKAKDKARLQDLMEHADTTPSVLCVNWDALARGKGVDIVREFLDKSTRNMIVLDESDYCKNPDSLRAKHLMQLRDKAAYRRIMTGTPITNSPFDAYSQFNFLSPDILNCPSYFLFKARHAVFLSASHPFILKMRARGQKAPQIVKRGPDGFPMYKNLEMLKQQIEPYSFRVLKKDCLDLPDKVYIKEYVNLTSAQEKAYQKIKDEGLAPVTDGMELPLANKLALLTCLCQVTGNHFPHYLIEKMKAVEGDGADVSDVIDQKVNPKLQRAMELIHEALATQQQVIIWARFRDELFDLEAACKAAQIPAVTYFGDTSEEKRIEAINKFQSGDALVFISNPQSGGTGITLTAGSVMIYYSNSFSLHDRLQSEDRCHRIGQKKSKVTYIDLLAQGTIDEKIQTALHNKQDIAQAVTAFKNFI